MADSKDKPAESASVKVAIRVCNTTAIAHSLRFEM